jgi:hypothetical protein
MKTQKNVFLAKLLLCCLAMGLILLPQIVQAEVPKPLGFTLGVTTLEDVRKAGYSLEKNPIALPQSYDSKRSPDSLGNPARHRAAKPRLCLMNAQVGQGKPDLRRLPAFRQKKRIHPFLWGF